MPGAGNLVAHLIQRGCRFTRTQQPNEKCKGSNEALMLLLVIIHMKMLNYVSSWNWAVIIGPDLTAWAWNMVMLYTLIHGGVHWAETQWTGWIHGQRTSPLLGKIKKNTNFEYNLVGPPVLSCAMMGKPVGPFPINWSLKEPGGFFSFFHQEGVFPYSGASGN